MKESAAYRRAMALLGVEAAMWRGKIREYPSDSPMHGTLWSIAMHLENMSHLLEGLALEADDPAAVACSACGGLFLKRTHNQKRCPVCWGEDYLRYRAELLRR